MTALLRQLRRMTAVAALAAAGCGGGGGGAGGAVDPKVGVLQEVGDLLRAAGATRPAAKPADLAKFADAYQRAYLAVKAGDVVVLYGGKVLGEGDMQDGGPVVAYDKATPAEGGNVLLAGGTVRRMTAAEFAAAPKAAAK